MTLLTSTVSAVYNAVLPLYLIVFFLSFSCRHSYNFDFKFGFWFIFMSAVVQFWILTSFWCRHSTILNSSLDFDFLFFVDNSTFFISSLDFDFLFWWWVLYNFGFWYLFVVDNSTFFYFKIGFWILFIGDWCTILDSDFFIVEISTILISSLDFDFFFLLVAVLQFWILISFYCRHFYNFDFKFGFWFLFIGGSCTIKLLWGGIKRYWSSAMSTSVIFYHKYKWFKKMKRKKDNVFFASFICVILRPAPLWLKSKLFLSHMMECHYFWALWVLSIYHTPSK